MFTHPSAARAPARVARETVHTPLKYVGGEEGVEKCCRGILSSLYRSLYLMSSSSQCSCLRRRQFNALMVVFVAVDKVALLPSGGTCAHDLIAQSWIR